MVYTKFQLSLLLLILENVTFSKTMEAPSEEKCWRTRSEQHRSPNSDSSQTLLGTVYNKRNVKMQNESTRKSRKEPQEGPCTHWKSINQFRAGSILWMKQSDKKVRFHGPQNGGHFSCGKPVPHLGTSTVGFLQLGENLLLRKLFYTLASPSTEKPDLCLRQENKVGSYACTGCNALCLNRTFRLDDPFGIAKCGDYFIPAGR